jgi:hypothetical protein
MAIRFQVDADFYDHPKTIGMSDGATALWVRAGSYSAAKLSDGFVADAALSLLSRCSDEAASELVERGLWRRVRGGFRFHQWDRRNLLRARVEAEREADRERKRRGRQQDGTNGKPQANGHVVRPESIPDADRNPAGVREPSVSVSVSVSGSGLEDESEPPTRCPKHLNTRNPPACGECADARRAHNRWQKAYNDRIRDAPKCRVHRGELADNCRACRSEELSPA